jgi:hypothetical protein
MVDQAQQAGVRMDTRELPSLNISRPILHDPSSAIRWGDPRTTTAVRDGGGFTRLPEDRQVVGGGRSTEQRDMQFLSPYANSNYRSLNNSDTHQFINYWERDPVTNRPVDTNNLSDIRNLRNRTGTVDMQRYMSELRSRGYCFAGESCSNIDPALANLTQAAYRTGS